MQLSTFLDHLPPQLQILRALVWRSIELHPSELVARLSSCCRSLSWLTLWESTQRNQDQPRHIQLGSPNSGRTQNSRHALSLRPRFRPGLHGCGKCAFGRALVGTAGALPALHQDISAPGKGLGGDSNFGQVTTAPFLLVKIIRVGIVCQFSCHCLLIRRVSVVFRLVKWLGVVVSTAACWGNLSFTDIVRRSIFSGI